MLKQSIGIVALFCTCSAASAETLTVAGVYAAKAEIDPDIHTIAVEGFGGDAGQELSFLLNDLLESVEVTAEPWYSIVPAATLAGMRAIDVQSSGGPDEDESTRKHFSFSIAVLRGTARSAVNDYQTSPKKVKSCAEREDGKCVERRVDVYECRNLTVSYSPSLRLIASNGKLLYENSDYKDATQTYCDDKDLTPDPTEMLASLSAQYAYAVRLEMAPQFREENFRILENRKGLSKADQRRFKEAVRLTKSDTFAACQEFINLETENPKHVSVLFNIGLCHESEGHLGVAHEYYLRTLSSEPAKNIALASLDRIKSRLDARRQISDHLHAR
jgi:hypothetical protein